MRTSGKRTGDRVAAHRPELAAVVFEDFPGDLDRLRMQVGQEPPGAEPEARHAAAERGAALVGQAREHDCIVYAQRVVERVAILRNRLTRRVVIESVRRHAATSFRIVRLTFAARRRPRPVR